MHKRWSIRRISLWTFLCTQIVLVLVYFSSQADPENSQNTQEKSSISFVTITSHTNYSQPARKYYTEHNKIILSSRYVEDLYEDFNTSLCYRTGTDLLTMKRRQSLSSLARRSSVSSLARRKDLINWKCLCLAGWHGPDCSQPEVVWRALLASKLPKSPVPRKIQRRLIYYTEVDPDNTEFVEIQLFELKEVAEIFILYDPKAQLTNSLNNGFLKELWGKLLYLRGEQVWGKVKRAIRNLRDDDIFFIQNPYEIANQRALMFLKLYDMWPEPLTFRLKWSVYGFFWSHPRKTSLATSACTVRYLREALEDNLDLFNYKLISKIKTNFIIGDLNHYGGWFCQFCTDSTTILKLIQQRNNTAIFNRERKIDVPFIEDLIENGLYVDGKLELERARRYNNYFAPDFVNNNSWRYDWLLTNLYSKLDYY